MTRHRLVRRTAFFLCLTPLLVGAAWAGDTKWDPTSTKIPETAAELESLQAMVQKVIEKCSPATVGVIIGAGAGSGVIVSEDGLVLTAAHVSGEPNRDCLIVLPDGTRLKGKTLGTNERKDSGMIKIVEEDPKKVPKDGKWPYLPMGKSGDLKKGQWVVSLGHPGGFKSGRTPVARLGQVQENRPARDLLRTNCTLVGGDSGGPLFDLNGNVVGIHSRISFSLDNNIHVPADSFKADWDQLLKGEQVGKEKKTAAVLGISFDDNAKDAKIEIVEDDGPAAKAGVKPGDVITKFDGEAVPTADDVRAQMKKRKPGDKVTLTVRRAAETVKIEVTLGKRPEPGR
jgi:serine protease Do